MYNVYKVHTIGDCYVVMGYSGGGEERSIGEECISMMEMAFSMVDVIKTVNRE